MKNGYNLTENQGEYFVDIPGYVGYYQISNHCRVKSLSREKFQYRAKSGFYITKEKILKTTSKRNYHSVQLFVNGKFRTIGIHRLMALAFIDNPNNYNCVNHINGITTDNRIENLEWVNLRENSTHGKLLRPKSSKYPGVYYSKDKARWASYIYYNKKIISLGRYKTEIEAYSATLAAHKKYGIVNKYAQQNEIGI